MCTIWRTRSHVRRVGLESSAAEGGVGAVLGQLPGAVSALQDLVGGRGSIDHVGDPSVPEAELIASSRYMGKRRLPARLDMGGVKFVLLVVDPSCPNCTGNHP